MSVLPPASGTSYLAVELAQKIMTVIRDFRQSHPGVSGKDIRQALRLVSMQTGAAKRKAVILAILTALVFLGVAASMFLGRDGGGSDGQSFKLIFAAVLVIIALVAVILRR